MCFRNRFPLMVILSILLLPACGESTTPTSPSALHLAARGTDRPLVGSCTVTVATRVHDEGGGCNGEEHDEDEGGGPPIRRHFDITGSCQLAHLGRTDLSGRLNITGPFGAGHGAGAGHGSLAVRGRLLFTAANGDQLAGRYVPVSAGFTPAGDGDGGMLTYSATEQIGEACTGHEGEVTTTPDHEEPVSTGRFVAATGTAQLLGTIQIRGSTGRGTGTVTLVDGSLSY
jgi:hypothetical protein